MKNPFVSVVIPNCGNDKTLPAAIHSIRTQTYTNHEIIVVDDSYGEKGVSEARNEGVAKAKGEYIFHQDADDFSLPDRLEKVMDFWLKPHNQGVGVVQHGIYINAWNKQYGCMERTYRKPEHPNERLYEEQTVIGVCAFKKSLWKKWPFRKETRYAYDWCMHLDWWHHGGVYAELDEGLYEYVRYAGSASDRFEKSGKRAEAFEIIRNIIKDEFKVDVEKLG